MPRSGLNRVTEHPEIPSTPRPVAHTASAAAKHARPVLKHPSKAALHKQRQVEMLIEWNVRLQHKLLQSRKKEAQSRYLAYRDELTGLPNRHLLEDRLNQAIPHAQRCHKPLAVLLLNLDEFTRVNSMLGRDSGDKLLQAVARRLSSGIRGADTASRYGGDEFVIVLMEIESPSVVAALVSEVRERLGLPYVIDDHEIRLTVSVGAAVYPRDGQTYEELMLHADQQMNHGKNAARGVSIVALPHLKSVAP